MAPATTDVSEVFYTLDEIQKHASADDCWLIIGNAKTGGPKVYDVTKYLDDHPGGAEVLLDVAGKDADEFFEDIGHSKEAREELKKHCIGNFKLDAAAIAALEKAAAEKKARQAAAGEKGPLTVLGLILAVVLAVGYAMYVQKKQEQ